MVWNFKKIASVYPKGEQGVIQEYIRQCAKASQEKPDVSKRFQKLLGPNESISYPCYVMVQQVKIPDPLENFAGI